MTASGLGAPFAAGRDADVYDLGGGRVLRRYRDGDVDTAPEAAVMAHVATHGYPVPTVYATRGPDLVMDRLDGPTMLGAFVAGTLPAEEGARILADLHTRLHALPPPAAAPPGTAVVHRDLHPENVVLTPHGPYVIDWRDALCGPPDLDLAMTALICAEVAVDPARQLAEAARALLVSFLAYAGGHPLGQLDTAAGIRAANPTLTPTEVARVDEAGALVVHSARDLRD
ncbi:phosphotransferase [Phytohabitans sp. ZYX-F-186]|uniref:Phosphotransferase n=1 Tax=Phytohabitans maris TaxID=3071409 RepID=A0ABU0ZNG2_9ACTN|nr:phosphotransferase [Phytohabitans sp. ZYX-F-186]MDQ7908581.1 phosphotransferase [Phytohabitans sp. ZYX-F-186]